MGTPAGEYKVCGYLIRLRSQAHLHPPSPPSSSPSLAMISQADLESAVRNAIPVTHLEIQDQSNGCGENYAIVVVSEVRAVNSIICE